MPTHIADPINPRIIDALAEVVAEVETTIGSEWNWLVRRNTTDGGIIDYFANITPARRRTYVWESFCPEYAETPEAALRASLRTWRMKFT